MEENSRAVLACTRVPLNSVSTRGKGFMYMGKYVASLSSHFFKEGTGGEGNLCFQFHRLDLYIIVSYVYIYIQ